MSLQVFPTSTIFYEKLRSERLHINHEQSILSSLNSVIDIEFKELSKKVWICRHEQELLHQLINSGDNVSPENCYQLLQNLHTAKFIEAYKILSYYAEELIQIYKILALSPKTVSLFLNAAEKINSLFSIDELCLSIFNVLYNACFFPEDEKRLLELLIHLITIQLIESPDPRKVLRKGNSTFSRMYRYFSEALPLNKIFLTAALHDPIMFLLSQDDLFLDIDPSKSPIRIPTAERHRRFGVDEKSSIYQEKFAQHRKNIVNKLVHITEKFIISIVNAIPIFPKSIKWLVCQMHNALIEKDLISKEEAALISTDLIFTYFICSAVINPEPLGIISDTPISYVARFNLMQIGQLLQTLAILPYEQQFPAYYNEILSRLNRNSMTKIMDLILSLESGSIEAIFPAQVPDLNGKEVYKRRTFVGTLQEINVLQSYLKSASIEEIDDINLRENLKNMIKRLPVKFDDKKIRIDQTSTQLSTSPGKEKIQTTMRLKSLADRVQTVASRSHQRLMQTCSVSNLRNFHHSSSSSVLNSAENNEDLNSEEDNDSEANKKQVVLIFSIVDNAEPIGLASEKEIMDGEFNFNEDNATKNEAFLDAKRKLQLVLSCGTSLPNNANFYVNRENENNTSDLFRKNDEKEAADIHHMLKLLLAESINNNEQKRTAQIREVQRCLSNFDNNEIAMLLRKMKEQQCERIIYIQYLQKSRLTLLQLEHCLKKMKNRIERETSLTSECLVEILVRFSLQKKDQLMRQFVLKFQRLKVQDEKIDLVESHLRHLFEQLVVEPMWRFATLENIEYARKCLERTIMTHIYVFALFPNGDADYYRDEVLNKSIDQLSKQITVDHVELAIPKGLHAECPWPSAQAELVIINAYKSPRDKMACITRCCETIENLIILSPGRNTASADDILPILVFVIIKANPPALLSNIQFIDGFYAKRMQGGEEYWWTQFNSAVEFLKTLLNKLCN